MYAECEIWLKCGDLVKMQLFYGNRILVDFLEEAVRNNFCSSTALNIFMKITKTL